MLAAMLWYAELVWRWDEETRYLLYLVCVKRREESYEITSQ